MNRLIYCPKCAHEAKDRFVKGKYQGEHFKTVAGMAINDYVCDFCDAKIPSGENCNAISIWADHSPAPYYPWEHEFLITEKATHLYFKQ